MPFVVTRPRTIWQPPLGATPRIDRGNPLSAGLIGAFLPGVPINVADGVGLGQISTAPVYGGRAGGLTITSSAVGYPAPSSSSAPEAKFDRSAFSALAICTQDAAENNGVAFFRGNGSGGAAWGVGVHGGSANGPYVSCGSYLGAPAVDLGGGWTRAVRTVLLVADGSTAFVYADGQFITSSSYTGPTYQYDPANWRRVIFGARNWVLTGLQSRAFLGLFWDRPLSHGEAVSVSTPNAAWSVFSAPERRVFFSESGVSGSLAYTNANDTSSASGSTTIVGTLARTNANDTSAASGTTTVVGAVSYTNQDDTVSASGNTGSGVSGSVNYTNANDTVSASGAVTIVGAVAYTNNNDAVDAVGFLPVSGSVDYTNNDDSLSASGVSGTQEAVTKQQAGGSARVKRRRFILPDNTEVYATQQEVYDLLQAFVKPKKTKKKVTKIVPLKDQVIVEEEEVKGEVVTRITTKSIAIYTPDPEVYEQMARRLRRRRTLELLLLAA